MQPKLPSATAVEYLHRRFAPDEDLFLSVFRHCEIVWTIAEQIINTKKLTLDVELIRVGAMLHDIGVYKLRPKEHYIRHGLQGATLLKKEGYPAEICRFAACHTGVGITKKDIESMALPLPYRNFVAETPEERLIMYADKFHSKFEQPHFNSYDTARQKLLKFGQEKGEQLDALAAEFGKPNLYNVSKHFGDPIV